MVNGGNKDWPSREFVGSLMWLLVSTRPDIRYVNQLRRIRVARELGTPE